MSDNGVLSTWKFDQNAIRNALTELIIINELPFKFIMVVACPRFKISSRWTISRDCYSYFVDERSKLKLFFKEHCQRVGLIADS